MVANVAFAFGLVTLLVLESLRVRPELLEGISELLGANEQDRNPGQPHWPLKFFPPCWDSLTTSGGSSGSNFYILFSFAAESTRSGLLKSGTGARLPGV